MGFDLAKQRDGSFRGSPGVVFTYLSVVFLTICLRSPD
jgi:hypothetical protein